MFYGIERAYCNAVLNALVDANQTMLDTLVEEAISKSHVPYKGDTLGLDQRPENTITADLKEFDQYAILITEERGEDANPLATTGPTTVHGARTFYGCDPCDRSSELCEFLQKNSRPGDHVADVIRQRDTITNWERSYGQPVSITGANAAITCIRRGQPICSAILNYITRELVVACSAGIYQAKLPLNPKVKIDFDFFRAKGSPLKFRQPPTSHSKRLVTFMGKPERGYPQNFSRSKLAVEHELTRHLHYDKPGGPTRILYLSSLQPPIKPVGFIVSNGEKIGEWLHWLPFILFANQEDDWNAKALRLFEVTQEDSLMRDGYLMMPSTAYSAFKDTSDGTFTINVDRLSDLDNPSKYRATLIVTPAINKWVLGRIEQYGYREIKF
ncbi:MAG: hypothetical protein ABIH36_02445 [bacterium]